MFLIALFHVLQRRALTTKKSGMQKDPSWPHIVRFTISRILFLDCCQICFLTLLLCAVTAIKSFNFLMGICSLGEVSIMLRMKTGVGRSPRWHGRCTRSVWGPLHVQLASGADTLEKVGSRRRHFTCIVVVGIIFHIFITIYIWNSCHRCEN